MPDYYFADGRRASGQVRRTAKGMVSGGGRTSGRKVYGIPTRYLSGLSGEERRARARAIIKGRKTGRRSRNSPGDMVDGKRRKLPESKYTRRFRERFG